MKTLIFKVVLLLTLVALMFTGTIFNLDRAKEEYINFSGSLNSFEDIKDSYVELENLNSTLRQELQNSRGMDLPNIEDIHSIYNSMESLDGVTSIRAETLNIIGDYTEVDEVYNKDMDRMKDGLAVTVVTEDINRTLDAFYNLKLPYDNLNLVYPKNEIIIKFNTRGGL